MRDPRLPSIGPRTSLGALEVTTYKPSVTDVLGQPHSVGGLHWNELNARQVFSTVSLVGKLAEIPYLAVDGEFRLPQARRDEIEEGKPAKMVADAKHQFILSIEGAKVRSK